MRAIHKPSPTFGSSVFGASLGFLRSVKSSLGVSEGHPCLVHCQATETNTFLVEKLCELAKSYHPLAGGGVAQTAFGTIRDAFCDVPLVREVVETPDGGHLFLHWSTEQPQLASRLLVLIPGVTGNFQSVYIQFLLRDAAKSGWDVVILTFRGLESDDLQSPMITCAADRSDINTLLRRISERTSPTCCRVGVAFSMGANMLVNHIALHSSKHSSEPTHFPPSCNTHSDICSLTAAVSVSNPFDFVASANKLHSTWTGRIMSQSIAKNLKKLLGANLELVKKEHVHPIPSRQMGCEGCDRDDALLCPRTLPRLVLAQVDLEKVMKTDLVNDFDEMFTSKICGYHSLNHYYNSASSSYSIPHVPIPLLVITSNDDPFVCAARIEQLSLPSNQNIIVLECASGGHVGFLDSSNPTTSSWAERVALEFADRVVQWKSKS
eukprot:c4001_g1_i1.p1 GENE.c4001_g1_i1~~c4001_g1_i1.p1  ORF type:complete len:448 (+),score=81.71 c4001_g1_i1:39-1346(+)